MDKSRIKHPELEMKHRAGIQIRFSDYDIFRHINNNSYMAYFDFGKSEFFNAVMGRPVTPADLMAAIVNINVDFLAPTPVGEPLEVQTAVERLGERSFTLYQRVVNPLSGDVKAQASTVLAGFDITSQGPGPLNPALTSALKPYTIPNT